jgi:hypothetical protein
MEIAHRLRDAGKEVAVLALVDPLAMDRSSRRRFGYWALWATWTRPAYRRLVRLAGALRVPFVRLLQAPRPARPDESGAPAGESFRALAEEVTRDRGHLMTLACLLELHTGLPFNLTDDDFRGVPPDEALGVLQERVSSLTPEVDPVGIERITIQYQLQVRSQHAYKLRPYRGAVLLVEPASTYSGLVATLLRPYVRRLTTRTVELGPPSERTRVITAPFGNLATHYRSMRDDGFVRGLAAELDAVLG